MQGKQEEADAQERKQRKRSRPTIGRDGRRFGDPDFMGDAEVAEMFGVHVETVRKWANDGVIPHTRLGIVYIFSRRQMVEAFDARALAEQEKRRGEP